MNEEPYSIFGIELLATQGESKNGKNICLNFTKVRAGKIVAHAHVRPGADLGGGCWGCAPPPPEMTCGFLIQLVFCKKKNYVVYWC